MAGLVHALVMCFVVKSCGYVICVVPNSQLVLSRAFPGTTPTRIASTGVEKRVCVGVDT